MEDTDIPMSPALMGVLDIICSVENKYVHQDIQCDNCEEPIFGVRFRCSNCEDFDLCSQCESSGAASTHDPSHSFHQILYRRLSLPPATGEDFALLQRFEQGKTSQTFYLYYPWFFGPPIFDKLISGTPNEDNFRDLLAQLEVSLDGVQLHVALDGVIRLLAPEDWNWRQVQDYVKPVIDLQLVRAEYSGLFHQLYLVLKNQSNMAESVRNAYPADIVALKTQLFSTNLDNASTKRCKDAMTTLLASRRNSDGVVEVPISTDNISESARYIELLSKGFDLNSSSLPILEHVEALLKRRKPGSPDVEWSMSQSMQRWQEYLLRYKQLFIQLERYFRECEDGVTNINNSSSPHCPPPESGDTCLASFTHLALCRDFKAAAEIIPRLDHLNPLHVFKMICFHELRGAFSEARRVAHSAVECFQAQAQGPEEFVFRELFKLCEAYFCCFTQGRWIEAMTMAINTLDLLVSVPKTELVVENSLIPCLLELYCFKIFLLGARDRNDLLQQDFASNFAERLRHLRHTLTRNSAHDLALDILNMELHVRQEEEMVFELEQTEYLHHRRIFVCQKTPATKSFKDFLSMLPECENGGNLSGDQTTGIEASARLLLGYALLENELDNSERYAMRDNLYRAWHLFKLSDSSLGQAEALLLSLRYHMSLNVTEPLNWDGIEACFRGHGYFKGLIKFYEFKAAFELNNDSSDIVQGSLLPTGPSLYQQLLPVAEEAGDKLLSGTCHIRSMRSWIEGPTFIMLCENVFHPNEGLLSDQLFLESSKLLSQLYEINNNFAESSAFALLHLRLAHARHDPTLLDYATMLYFRCVGNMVSTIAGGDRIYEVASLAFSFDRVTARLCNSALAQMEASVSTISAGSLPIESLLWPAHLVRHVVEDDGIQSMSPQVILVVYRSLKLAVDLLLLLPSEFQGLFFSEACQALGTAAEMLANPMLSLLSYDLGQSQPVGSDGYRQAILQLKIGRRMTSWIYSDRPAFLGLQDVAFAYLDQAAEFLWGEGSRQSSYKNGLETSLILARAHLREVQCLIEELDWGENTEGDDDNMTDEQQANKQRLLCHVEAGLLPIQKAIAGNLARRRRLRNLPAMQALENSRLFYFSDMEELYWNEMGLEMDKSRMTRDPGPLFMAIQKWKAVSLQDTISRRIEYGVQAPDLVAFSSAEPDISSISTALNLGDEPPAFQEESLWDMAEIAKAHLEKGQSIIFVEWTRYYDTLFFAAYNGTEGRIKKKVLEIDYHTIEEWVRCELGVSSLHQGHTDRRRLQRFTRLKDLTSILENLEGFAKPKDLLVLCPTGILHAVPLQAIPFGSQGRPLIASNPVVFCPSLSLLQTCVNNVKNSAVLDVIPTAAFTRLGPGDAEEEARMLTTAQNGLADELLQTSFASGTAVTREIFMSQSRGARLLHYHGHAYLEAAQRRDRALQLEPQLDIAESPGDEGLLSVMDIFGLHLDSAVVVLLACASGEDDIAPNDDPLGLLSAFLYAGASSVIATRWPTQTSDAREFAKHFYKKVFSSRKDGIVNLAVAVQEAVLELWEHWDEDDPYHWAQFQLYGSWFGKV